MSARRPPVGRRAPMSSREARGLAPVTDGACLSWTALGDTVRTPPLVILHGGPGLPDYLGDVASMIEDLAPVFRYDQRGTGRSPWQGRHTSSRHVSDLAELLDLWEAPTAVLIGHSYGTDLACRFCLAHPDRVAAMLLMAGPFVGDWRAGDRLARSRRMSAAQQNRYRQLDELPHRTEDQELEWLTLGWFTDHFDPGRGWSWAAEAARERSPINYTMNGELGKERRTDPLDLHLDELSARLPPQVEILGSVGDPRPLSARITGGPARRSADPDRWRRTRTMARAAGRRARPPAEVCARKRRSVRGPYPAQLRVHGPARG